MSIQQDDAQQDTNPRNPKEVLKAAVMAAQMAEGHVLPDGKLDRVKIRERIFTELHARKVLTLKERGEKAITRGEMVEKIYPSLPGPESWPEQDDPQLAQDVWHELNLFLWGIQSTNAASPLQRLVALNMGNGYILCRTKIGKDQAAATYITDDFPCVDRDLITPSNQALARLVTQHAQTLEMLIQRKPEHAKRILRGYDGHLKAVTSAGHDQLTLAIESAMPSRTEPEEDQGEPEN